MYRQSPIQSVYLNVLQVFLLYQVCSLVKLKLISLIPWRVSQKIPPSCEAPREPTMYLYINRNARPNNNQLITYYQRVSYLLRIQQHPVNNTYNIQLLNVSQLNVSVLMKVQTKTRFVFCKILANVLLTCICIAASAFICFIV